MLYFAAMETYKKLCEVGASLHQARRYDLCIRVLHAAQKLETNQTGITMKVLITLANAHTALKHTELSITLYQVQYSFIKPLFFSGLYSHFLIQRALVQSHHAGKCTHSPKTYRVINYTISGTILFYQAFILQWLIFTFSDPKGIGSILISCLCASLHGIKSRCGWVVALYLEIILY